jgi:alcohol dehydrogenase
MPTYEMRKFVAPEFIFGVGARHRVGHYAQNLAARRVLIVSDPGVIAAGWLDQVETDLQAVGIEYAVFHGLTANPKDYEVMAGAAFYAEQHCDLIVAIGGGSVMDCAKGIGIVHTNNRDIRDFEGIDRIPHPGPPLICIPTTAGTAAEISQFCIIVHQNQHYKMSIISKSLVPDVSLIDPETTLTMPTYLAACTGIDALTHAIEAFVSTASSPISDLHAQAAIELLWNNMEAAVAKTAVPEAQENMLLGSLYAGLAFSNTSLGAIHAMAHSLGGYLDLPHGECNALLLDHVVRFNMPACADRYTRIGNLMGLNLQGLTQRQGADRIANSLLEMRRKVGIEAGLGQRQVHAGDIPELSRHAYHDVCLVTNPRRANQDDLKTIFHEAL